MPACFLKSIKPHKKTNQEPLRLQLQSLLLGMPGVSFQLEGAAVPTRGPRATPSRPKVPHSPQGMWGELKEGPTSHNGGFKGSGLNSALAPLPRQPSLALDLWGLPRQRSTAGLGSIGFVHPAWPPTLRQSRSEPTIAPTIARPLSVDPSAYKQPFAKMYGGADHQRSRPNTPSRYMLEPLPQRYYDPQLVRRPCVSLGRFIYERV